MAKWWQAKSGWTGRGFRRGIGAGVLLTVAVLLTVGVQASISGAQTPTAPVITSAASATFEVGLAGTFTVTATGDPTPTLDETGTLPSGVSYSGGVFSGTPAKGTAGVYALTVVATNGVSPDAIQTLDLSVVLAPAITSKATTTFTVGSAGTFSVKATGSPPPSFSEAGTLPSGVTLSSLGALSGTPPTGTDGTYPITITASNGASPSATQNFTLVVATVPAITSATTTTFTVGSAGTFSFTATGDPVPAFSESGALPGGVTLSAAGLLAGTPTAAGVYDITVTASNGASPSATQSFTLDVVGPPVIVSATTTAFLVGQVNSFTVRVAADPVATISETGSLPAGVSFDAATGVLSSTTALSTTGDYPITFGASNGLSPDASQNFTLIVGTPPVFTSPISATMVAGKVDVFSVTTSGFPTPRLSMTGPGFLYFTDYGNGTGILWGEPSAKFRGIHAFTFTAKSSTGSATQTFYVVLQALPVFKSASSATFTVGEPGGFEIRVVSYPRSSFAITAGSLPSGLLLSDFGNDSAIISGTPQVGTEGSYPLTIQATAGPGSTTQAFTLNVSG